MCKFGEKHNLVILGLLAVVGVLLAGCAGHGAENKGQTLHAKQVLERYDANSQPVAQYLELWAAPPQALCHELDADGNTIGVALDNATDHLRYDAKTRKASRQDAAAVFHVDFAALRAGAKASKAIGKLQYAGRACLAWMLDGDDEGAQIKLYVDEQTGWVLFCDAPTFRLRTASMDFVAADDSRFATPAGLQFQ